MLGILLIYFIWKQFNELAVQYHKKPWRYELLGIATYYIGTFIGGMMMAIICVMIGSDLIVTTHELVLGLLAMPFGILCVWGLYKLLQHKWATGAKAVEDDPFEINQSANKN
ncbi:MAG: hypothetical protein V4580_15020 [Bacteroidota bacterium]